MQQLSFRFQRFLPKVPNGEITVCFRRKRQFFDHGAKLVFRSDRNERAPSKGRVLWLNLESDPGVQRQALDQGVSHAADHVEAWRSDDADDIREALQTLEPTSSAEFMRLEAAFQCLEWPGPSICLAHTILALEDNWRGLCAG